MVRSPWPNVPTAQGLKERLDGLHVENSSESTLHVTQARPAFSLFRTTNSTWYSYESRHALISYQDDHITTLVKIYPI